MTYVELNDEYNSIIDTRGIRNMYATSASVNCHFLKIDKNNNVFTKSETGKWYRVSTCFDDNEIFGKWHIYDEGEI